MHLSGISAFAAPALPTAPRPLPEAGMIQVGDQQQKVGGREGEGDSRRVKQEEGGAGGGREGQHGGVGGARREGQHCRQ